MEMEKLRGWGTGTGTEIGVGRPIKAAQSEARMLMGSAESAEPKDPMSTVSRFETKNKSVNTWSQPTRTADLKGLIGATI